MTNFSRDYESLLEEQTLTTRIKNRLTNLDKYDWMIIGSVAVLPLPLSALAIAWIIKRKRDDQSNG
jgi:hypothetical protein